MQERARVVKLEGDVVSVVPLDIEACIGCSNSECKKNGSIFTAVNRLGLDLRPGVEVRIAAPARKQLEQALFAVGVPVLGAVAAWKLTARFFPACGEGVRAAIVLAAFVVGAVLVYAFSRAAPKDLPEIVEIL